MKSTTLTTLAVAATTLLGAHAFAQEGQKSDRGRLEPKAKPKPLIQDFRKDAPFLPRRYGSRKTTRPSTIGKPFTKTLRLVAVDDGLATVTLPRSPTSAASPRGNSPRPGALYLSENIKERDLKKLVGRNLVFELQSLYGGKLKALGFSLPKR